MTAENAASLENMAHLARLARLDLHGPELKSMARHMDKIIDAVSTLAELDTSKVEPYGSSAQGQANLRQDHIKPSLSVDQALANAPAKGSEGFAVPAIHD